MLRQVAKLIIIDNDDKYLLMYRKDHPIFGKDPDLPGGTQEDGESGIETMIREAEEEAGIIVDESKVELVYEGSAYRPDRIDSLYRVKLSERPTVTMSWEHGAYEWLDRDAFLEKAKGAVDTYMHMVYGELSREHL